MERSLKFHRFYVVFLYIRGVVSIGMNVGSLSDLYQSMYYAGKSSSDMAAVTFFVGAIIAIEATLNFVTATQLKNWKPPAFNWNIALLIFSALSAGINAANSSGFLGFILGGLATGAYAIPIIIYYSKRRDLTIKQIEKRIEEKKPIIQKKSAVGNEQEVHQLPFQGACEKCGKETQLVAKYKDKQGNNHYLCRQCCDVIANTKQVEAVEGKCELCGKTGEVYRAHISDLPCGYNLCRECIEKENAIIDRVQ